MNNQDYYNKEYVPQVNKIGKITGYLGVLLSFTPALVLAIIYGILPKPAALLTAFISGASAFGVLWFVEPISYFPVVGAAGTYMAFLSGNISNMRIPCASMAQVAADVEPGTEKGSVVATLGMAVSIVINVSVLGIMPQPKTREALESSAREEILRQQDDAIYKRRNFAIEQERSIKENELNTEITIAEKEREKQEKAIDAKMALQQKNAEAKMQQLNDEHEFLMRDVEAHAVSDKALHEKNMESCSFEQKEQAIKNETQRSIADTKAYESDVLLKVFAHIDKDVLTALLLSGMDSGKMIAKAFGDLAANSEKIGNLNITPDLLDTLVKRDGEL